jgi:biotin carboxyl carrier protein
MKIKVHMNGQSYEVLVEKNGGDYRVTVGETTFKVIHKEGGLIINGEFVPMKLEGSLEEGTTLQIDNRTVQTKVEPVIELERAGEGYSEAEESGSAHKDSQNVITAPMPGKVVSIKVKVGEEVNPNTLVLVLEAMKMENEILAGISGKIKEIKVKPGEAIEGGKIMAVIE